MLSSWMQKACPAAPVTFRTIRDVYMQWLLYTGAQSFGGPKLLVGTPCDPYTQPSVHMIYIRMCFAGAQSSVLRPSHLALWPSLGPLYV